MDWVIKFLSHRLRQEQDIAAFHGSITRADRKYAESARMALERIPQLQRLIELAKAERERPPVKRKVNQDTKQIELF